MTLNSKLLTETMDYIEAHPEEHVQGDWRCASGKCFAGLAAELDGWTWLVSDLTDELRRVLVVFGHRPVSQMVVVDTKDEQGTPVRAVIVRDAAVASLGISHEQAMWLFSGDNTVETLRLMVDALLEDPRADLEPICGEHLAEET